jgi:hypothetical protein
MTRSALASTLWGIVNPICSAAFRLLITLNFVACSTGKLARFHLESFHIANRP